MQQIGIDVGRDQVKVVSGEKQIAFKARVGEWRQRKLTKGGDYTVEINGKRHFIGQLAEESYFSREMVTESKIHEETKILFLTALALVAEPGKSLEITTGLPIDQHTKEIKAEMMDLLKGHYTVTVNDKFITFKIDRIGIAPEGGGAFWDCILNLEGHGVNPFLSKARVRCVDIGSRTINMCTINQRKYLDRDSKTLGYGTLELLNANPNPGPEEWEQFSRKIVGDLAKHWLNYSPSEDIVLIAGGGSISLKPWLEKHFPLNYFAEDPVFSNARGFCKMEVLRCATKA